MRLDVAGAASRELRPGPVREVRPSVDNRRFVLLRQTDVVRPEASRPLTHMGDAVHSLEIVDADGRPASRGLDGFDVIRGSARWSPDGQEIAFLVRTTPGTAPSARAFRYRVGTALPVHVGPDNLDPTSITWASDSPLVLGACTGASGKDARPNWWLVPPAGAPQNLTASLTATPAQVIAEPRWAIVGRVG